MPFQDGYQFSGGHVPYLHLVLVGNGTRDQRRAVGRERQRIDVHHVCPASVPVRSRDATSHSVIQPSPVPAASIDPSGENASDRTSLSLTRSVAISSYVFVSHSLMVLSPDPDASVVPSGDIASSRTNCVCPSSVAR